MSMGEVLNALVSSVQDCAKKETNAKKLQLLSYGGQVRDTPAHLF